MDSMEKACVVKFDEMSIKQALEYNSNFDLIEGYEDAGSLGRQPKIGKQACVFMVRGLYYHWKIPVYNKKRLNWYSDQNIGITMC